MPVHVVRQGECFTTIADLHGFADPRDVADHPENRALRARRPDPNILHPGDRVFVPDREIGVVARPTGARHRFVAKRPARRLHVVLKSAEGVPFAGVRYRILLEGATIEGTTGGDGAIRHDIPIQATEAKLDLGDVVVDLAIGWLNPLRDAPDGGVSGVQARLRNLGHEPGSVSGELDAPTRAAIESYQRARGLPVDGALSPALLSALEREHGC
jgi:N-acetylmuramoyl-L-alanine amidase